MANKHTEGLDLVAQGKYAIHNWASIDLKNEVDTIDHH